MEPQVVGLDGCAVRAVDRDRVDAARARLIALDEAGELADLFRLLGDPSNILAVMKNGRFEKNLMEPAMRSSSSGLGAA